MRVAILYSGQLRTWNTCSVNQYDNIIRDNTDLYFFTTEEPENTVYKQFVQDHGSPYYPDPMHDYGANKNPITQLNGTLNQWHVNFVSFALVPKGYDCYVRSRPDIVLTGPINFGDYAMTDNDIYIPMGNDHCGGVNDQFAFGSYSVMKKYFSIYLEHGKLFQQGLTFHTESYLTQNLIRLGVTINRVNVTNHIVR